MVLLSQTIMDSGQISLLVLNILCNGDRCPDQVLEHFSCHNGTAFDIPDHLLMEDGLTSDETPFGDFHSWMATCTVSFA